MRKIDCPLGGWIGLPDEWQGKHAQRRDESVQDTMAKKLPATWASFAVAMALLDDWGDLPNLGGNPAAWDFLQIRWALMAWVSSTVMTDLNQDLRVPKNSLPPSPDGLTAAAGAPGSSSKRTPKPQ